MSDPIIHHTVFFDLAHAPGSAPERAFLARAAALGSLPAVEAFRCVREVSPRNPFRFGLTMRFAGRDAYDRYDRDPVHRSFVEECWIPHVTSFQEIDYVDLDLDSDLDVNLNPDGAGSRTDGVAGDARVERERRS